MRIIQGKWRNKKIPTISHPNLRPTTNKIREILFNCWLSSAITNSACLDCFAGSGSLGMEALSRNASQVTFIEQIKKISNNLNKIKKIFNAHNAHIIHADAQKWLTKSNDTYDIIFLDPPFQSQIINNIIHILIKYHHLKNNTLIYVEFEKSSTILNIPNSWKCIHKKNHKNYTYKIYQNNN